MIETLNAQGLTGGDSGLRRSRLLGADCKMHINQSRVWNFSILTD